METRSFLIGAPIALLAVALGAALFAGCQSGRADSPPSTTAAVSDRQPAISVRQQSEAVNDADFVGVLVPHQSLDLAAKFDGRIAGVYVRFGDRVKRGSLLATQDSRSITRDVAIAEASLHASQAEHDRTEIELAESTARLDRLRNLGDLIAVEQLATAESQEKVAAARVQTSLAEVTEKSVRLEQLRETLSDAQIRAMFDGTIAARYVEPGTTVGRGTPIVRLIDATDLRVRFAIPEEQAPDAIAGRAVLVRFAPTLALKATIENVAPEVDASLRMVVVEGRLVVDPNAPVTLPPGAVARISFAKRSTLDSDRCQR